MRFQTLWMGRMMAALLVGLGLGVMGVAGADIPERPEALKFPPLRYEPPSPADYRVPLAAGPVAYLVPDRELPLVNIVVLVRVGQYLEPVGKEGLADLTGYLLARGGTARLKADALDERLAFLAANLASSIGDTAGSLSLNLLSKDLDEGLSILKEVLVSPAFQEDKLMLRKQQMLQAMRQRNDEAEGIQRREVDRLAYGEAFWVNRLPTAASLESITRGDIEAFHRRWFLPSSMVVAVSGDFDRELMKAKLEAFFKEWPFRGDPPGPVPADTVAPAPGLYMVDKDINQGRVSVLLPGLKRDDPEFFQASVMSYILGGGGFTSRLMNRIRSDEGLAYSVYTMLAPGVHYATAMESSFESKSRTVAKAASIVFEEMERITREPVSAEELGTALRYFVDSFPRRFATKGLVAGTFAQDELSGRYAQDPHYWREFRARISRVTADQVQAAAKRLLKKEAVAVLVVGQKEEILKGHPDHPARLEALAGGKVVELPLRDPMTLKPVSK